MKLRAAQSPLYLLGPALAQSGPWETFATNVINDLLGMYGSEGIKTLTDREFGWSHHNYGDVEKIGQRLQSVNAAFAAAGPLVAEATKAKAAKAIAPSLYGTGTQTLRTILNGKWKGWADSGDPDPTIFLTEGGAALEAFPSFLADQPRPDPNAHYNAAGQQTSDPAAHEKQLQAYSVGGAAVALQRRTEAGEGVEMFTNFLCFDDNLTNFSGLCDQYAPDRVSPPYPRGAQTTPAPEANLPAKDYERPSYTTWKNFNLSNIPAS